MMKRAKRICQRRTRRLEKMTIRVKPLEDNVDNVEKNWKYLRAESVQAYYSYRY